MKMFCFDLWKTLAYEPISSREYFDPLFAKYPAITYKQIRSLVDELIMSKPISLEDGVSQVLERLCIVDPEIGNDIVHKWNGSCNRASLFPEVISCLKKLRQQYTLVLITNTSKYGWNQLQRRYSIGRYFDLLCLSFELRMVKPKPEIFRYALGQWNSRPQECAMVGDSEPIDLAPARQLGFRTFLVRRTGTTSAPPGNTVIQDLQELCSIVAT